MTLAGFPHSGTPGSTPTCGSPRLFAACRALLRLSVPRHPPCALVRLTGSLRTCTEARGSIPAHRFPDQTHSVGALAPLSRRYQHNTQFPRPRLSTQLTTTRIEECSTSGRSTRERFRSPCSDLLAAPERR